MSDWNVYTQLQDKGANTNPMRIMQQTKSDIGFPMLKID